MAVKKGRIEIVSDTRGEINIVFNSDGRILPEVKITGNIVTRDILSLQPVLVKAFKVYLMQVRKSLEKEN